MTDRARTLRQSLTSTFSTMNEPHVHNRIAQDVAGFSLTFKDFRPHGVLRQHRSKRAGVCVVVGGGLSESDAQGIHAFGTADAVFRPPAEPHCNVADCTGARVVLVEASETRLAEFERSGLHVKHFVARRSPVAAGIGLRIGQELLSLEASPLVLEGLALQLWGEVLRPRSSGMAPIWAERVREFIAANPACTQSSEELAEVGGVSVSHLSKAFRTFFGRSIAEYRLSLRIENATRLLTDTSLPIAQVSLLCGFYDQSHFTRAFCRTTGCTPRSYRRGLRYI